MPYDWEQFAEPTSVERVLINMPRHEGKSVRHAHNWTGWIIGAASGNRYRACRDMACCGDVEVKPADLAQ